MQDYYKNIANYRFDILGELTRRYREALKDRYTLINKELLMKIPMYMGRRIKDGSLVAGYPAIGSEGNTAWIMAPTDVSDDQFRMYNVDPKSLERID